MSRERLEKANKILNHIKGYGVYDGNDDIEIFEWLIEQAEQKQPLETTVDFYQSALRDADRRVQELESFKKSVEYTVDSETLELIIDNQDSDRVLSFSETYDEKIFLLQKQIQELEKEVRYLRERENEIININQHRAKYLSEIESRNILLELDNKRYREALEFYANEENYFFDEKEYKVGLGVPESEITIDYGNKARKALEGEE